MALSRGCSDKKTWSTCRSAPIRGLDILGELRALAATDKGMETTLRHMHEMTKNAEHENARHRFVLQTCP